jgi:hypothetical protein
VSDWTLGAVKARNMEIVALCEQEGCRHMFVFNLDELIEGVGADYKLADIPPALLPPMRGRAAADPPVLPRPAARGRSGVVFSASWPGLSRQSIPFAPPLLSRHGMDARIKSGHDEESG